METGFDMNNGRSAVLASNYLSARNLGVIYYNPVEGYTSSHTSVMDCTLSANRDITHVYGSVGESAADVIAGIAGGIIAGLAAVYILPTTIATAIATSIFSAMTGAAGVSIADGLITGVFADSYECVVLEKSLVANFRDLGVGVSYSKDYFYEKAFVSYDGFNYENPEYGDGFDERNWATPAFANTTWIDMVFIRTGLRFPGVKNYVINDPANG